jgi:hypothetical protein
MKTVRHATGLREVVRRIRVQLSLSCTETNEVSFINVASVHNLLENIIQRSVGVRDHDRSL